MKTILIIDDDEDFAQATKGMLVKKGYQVEWIASAKPAFEMISQKSPACILLDLVLQNEGGLDVLSKIQAIDKNIPVIMLTGHRSVASAVEAMKRGAFHYMEKPVKREELFILLEKAMEQRDLYEQIDEMKGRLGMMEDLEEFMASSENLQKAVVISQVRSVAATDVNVLLYGESGTGKELVARVTHQLSSRKKGPFVPIDCASIPETLIESELFGHEKGSFTGAVASQPGKFELANNGTIFLDEVSNIPMTIQAKLLRFLERHELVRIGGKTAVETNLRVIAATNQDLAELAQEGKFRMDLYYRLNEFPIHLLPLRERKEDIPLLCKRFLMQFQKEIGREIPEIGHEAMTCLQTYDYPGNIRELRNIIKRGMVVANRRIEVADLPQEVRNAMTHPAPSEEPAPYFRLPKVKTGSLSKASRQASDQIERQLIVEALKKTEGHQGKAAQLLGITPRTLYNKMKAHSIEI